MKPLVLTVGDPAGIGPEIVVQAVRLLHLHHGLCVIGDARRLTAMLWPDVTVASSLGDAKPGVVAILDAGETSDAAVTARGPTAEGGAFQLRALDHAIDLALVGRVRAIVTGPVAKEAVTLSGTPFVGQTEHLARRAGLADDDVTMLFLGDRLNTSLVTTHLALRDVSSAITAPRVRRASVHLAEALIARIADRRPRLVVAGLNPHASEHGLFGDEEARVIEPVVAKLSSESAFAERVDCLGVRAAEAAFRDAASGRVDGVVAMFHDQATLASKLLDWGSAVNVTWGLPFLRTSVDHGVAYDISGRGVASADGMLAAVRMAITLTESR